MHPAIVEMLIDASANIPTWLAKGAQLYGVTLPPELTDKLPMMGAQIPGLVNKLRKTPLDEKETEAAREILTMNDAELRLLIRKMFREETLSDNSRSFISGIFGALKIIDKETLIHEKSL